MGDLNYVGRLLRPYCNEKMYIANRKLEEYGNSFPPLSIFLYIVSWMKFFPQDLSILTVESGKKQNIDLSLYIVSWMKYFPQDLSILTTESGKK
jgi:hypothetical protein